MMSTTAHFLGVDGGGSKTAFALVDSHGVVSARITSGSSYYFNSSSDVMKRVLAEGVSQVCVAAGITPEQIDAAFFGLPGYGEASGDVAELDAMPARILGHDRYRCDNDMVCGWAGSLAGEDGINVISGTGSMTYGERLGAGHRVGGWGELFGDEGSAYWIATRGLNVFSRMSDGRTPRGPLHGLLVERLGLSSDLDAVGLVIGTWGGDRSRIAALATTVCEAARQGDSEALGVVSSAVRELATLIETTRSLLGFSDDEVVPVSYSGGMFTDVGYLTSFRAALGELPAEYDLRVPLLDPALGAAVYAAKDAGTPFSTTALQRLRSTHTSTDEVETHE
ncbi:BadF/BadG/BcrA/BcrD ATPase family protein [Rhodococcus sp. MEB041]|uniref:N-acetylglucosamine kinase n=1 Tax=Rhodococcus sp. MEB041 TaxID=3040323 RepID=UPI0033079F5F